MKHFTTTIYAVLALIFTISCTQQVEPLGSSSISFAWATPDTLYFPSDTISAQTLSIETQDEWMVSAPSWMGVSPKSGKGNCTLTVKPEGNYTKKTDPKTGLDYKETNAPRCDILYIVNSARKISLYVSQSGDPSKSKEIKHLTIKQFLEELPDNTTDQYEVTGKITEIESASKGTFYISDLTGTLYVYKATGLTPGGNTFSFANLDLATGDEITLYGKKTTYKGAKEMENAIIRTETIVKSLLAVESDDMTVESDDTTVTVAVMCKGLGIEYESSTSWATVNGFSVSDDITYFTVRALKNTESWRTASITFKTTDIEGGTYSAVWTLTQLGPEKNINVAELVTTCPSYIYPAAGQFCGYFSTLKTTFICGGYVYLKDYSGEILAYDTDFAANLRADTLSTVINGMCYGKYCSYYGLPYVSMFNADEATTRLEKSDEPTEMTVSELLGNFEPNLNHYLEFDNVTVTKGLDGASQRDGQIEQDGATIALRDYTKATVIPQGSKGDLVAFPAYYKGEKVLCLYRSSQFTAE